MAHFADTKLDSRYKLFMKDGGQFDSSNLGHRGVITLTDKTSPSRDKLFQYLLNHPNLRTVDPIIAQVAEAIEAGLRPGISCTSLDCTINDPEFARGCVETLLAHMRTAPAT